MNSALVLTAHCRLFLSNDQVEECGNIAATAGNLTSHIIMQVVNKPNPL